MREILFRGKLVINNEWAYSRCPDGTLHSGIVKYDFIPETVGQFTGLTDKNGKKIFEGDILEAIARNPVGEPIVAEVVPNLNDYELMWDIEHSYEIEVIGNIHDNPELLEESA